MIPDSAQKNASRGTVIAVGPGAVRHGRRVPLDCRVGDAVVFPPHLGAQVTVDGEEFTLMTEDHVMAVEETAGADAVTEEERTP